jgi:hypothetical protein
MKTNFKKLIAATGFIAAATTILVGCASQPLEQQIAVKEAGSWDFKTKTLDANGEPKRIVRIYDKPGKLGFEVFEYGQKHPCNQGFQKVIKKTAPGLVRYATDLDSRSFACTSKLEYIFRTDANGHPYEGWEMMPINDREKKEFPDFVKTVKYFDDKNMKPNYFVMK